MRVPSAPHVLSLWEQGQQARRGEVALAWLRAAFPERSASELAALPIGRRDRLLLELRARLFGPALHLRAACPACGEAVEAELDALPAGQEPLGEYSVEHAGKPLRFRLPSAADVAGAAASRDPQRTLLARCMLDAVDDVSDELAAAVLTAMAEHDPDADLRLGLDCPACAHAWSAALDVVGFFRAELAAWASRFAAEVDVLARAYAWSEADILALSPARRQLYLDRVTA